MSNYETQPKSQILLETGTNEFEIVEFSIGNTTYGINVAKVREVINLVNITQIPSAHPFVDGVFTLRGKVIPLINLATCLGMVNTDPKRIIISELNNYRAGFLVDDVFRIHRISWTKMEPAPEIANSHLVVGIIKLDDKMVILLDFERIIAETNPEINKNFHEVKLPTIVEESHRANKTILLAEDSPLLKQLIIDTLHSAGYKNIIYQNNGLAAWNKLVELSADTEDISSKIQLIITDIEMPQMDGHHLIKRIRENASLKKLPIIIFSSLINEENRRKGAGIGATDQVSKPEIDRLIATIDSNIL